ncbi:MAG: type II toxin-antitoxin system RelE/ParE family toxin [Prochlorococcaceae cyanobacterium]
MVEVRQTARFAQWLEDLRDLRARARVQARIERLIGGNPGDARPVGSGVSELRINYGPGYRVYYQQKGSDLIILLAGGDKSTQASDIDEALMLARQIKEERP